MLKHDDKINRILHLCVEIENKLNQLIEENKKSQNNSPQISVGSPDQSNNYFVPVLGKSQFVWLPMNIPHFTILPHCLHSTLSHTVFISFIPLQFKHIAYTVGISIIIYLNMNNFSDYLDRIYIRSSVYSATENYDVKQEPTMYKFLSGDFRDDVF